MGRVGLGGWLLLLGGGEDNGGGEEGIVELPVASVSFPAKYQFTP